ncbi:hypothetical protein AAC387_Pa09g1921 [Persea americana]
MERARELVIDCKTRWNSTYLMLSTAVMYKDVFFRLKQRDSSYDCMPSEEECEVAVNICKKLKLFFNVTKLFSGTTYPTANIYFPKVCEIKISLAECCLDSNVVIKNMAFQMFEKFNSYWNVIRGIMGVATVLNPRYKMMLLEFYFPTIYGDRADDEIRKIKVICEDLMHEYNSQNMDTDSNDSFTLNSNVVKKYSLASFDQFVSSRKKGSTGNIKLELDHYLEDDVLPCIASVS